MTHEEMVAENERAKEEFAARIAEYERKIAKYDAIQKQINWAIKVYIDVSTAPLRALVDDIRDVP